MTERPGRQVDPDAASLAPHEEAALADAMRPVAIRGRGVTIAAILIVAAFAIGLLRPWDWLLPAGGSAAGGTRPVASVAVAPGPTRTTPTGDGSSPEPTGRALAPTCGYPDSWRSATLQRWAGQRARVWTAVDVAPAPGPDDPAIPFQIVAGEDFRAIGWCAPVTGAERPPSTALAKLFRIEEGVAVETLYIRLEPTAPTELGELWAPADTPTGASAAWPYGRYVIELATPDGSWSRYLGMELRGALEPATAPPPTQAPVDVGSPVPTAGQSG
jgi:hypothetical protein